MSDQFVGLIPLGNAVRATVVTKNNATTTPQDASAAPAFRVYGPGSSPMPNGSGNLSLKDPSATGGLITNATNATPIVVTSAGHGLTTGTRVTISGVTGNVATNGDWQVTVIDPSNFSLNGSGGSGAYVTGGVWHVSGLYDVNFTPLGADGYIAGGVYSMLVTYQVAGVPQCQLVVFQVV